MKSKGILFLATLAILVMTIVSVSASTKYYYPQTGSDDTTPSPYPLHHLLTPTELNWLNLDDGNRYRNNESWYADYEDTEYIDYIMNGNISSDSHGIRTWLKFNWQRNSAVDEARIMLWIESEDSWSPPIVLERPDLGQDHTQNVEITSYINSVEDVNNLVVRFQAKDDECGEDCCFNSWTWHDLVEFKVTYDDTDPNCSVDYLYQKDTHNEYFFNDSIYLNENGLFYVYGSAWDDQSPITNVQYNRTSPNLYMFFTDADPVDGHFGSLFEQWRSDPNDGSFIDGWHTICCRAVECSCEPCNPGNVQDVPTCREFCIDTQDPDKVIGVIHSNPSDCVKNYVNEAPKFSWDETDDNGCAGIDYYEYNVYYSNGTLYYNDTTKETSMTVENPVDGEDYYIEVRAVDNAENEGDWSDPSVHVWYDSIKPEVEITSPENESWFKDDFQVSETDSDNLALWKCFYKIDDGSFNETQCNQNITVMIPEDCSDGKCVVYKMAKDNACNEAQTSATYNIDTIPPITTKIVGTPNVTGKPDYDFYVRSDTEFNFICFDLGIGCDEIYYRYQYPNGTWTEWLTTAPFNLIGPDGIYHLEYYSIDKIGNEEVHQFEIDYLDNTGPTVHKSVGDPQYPFGNDWYVTDHTPFNFTCDDGNGVDSGTVTVDGEIYTAPLIGKTFSLPDGEFSITYYCTDALGNKGDEETETDFMDKTAPTIEIVEPSQMEHEFGCEVNIFTVKARVTDDGSGVGDVTAELLYKNETPTGRTCTMTLKQGYYSCNLNHWGLLAGEYLVKVTASDNVENQDSKDVYSQLTYDVYFGGCTGFTVLKGESGTTTFDVNLCHGGDAVGMLMTKLCGVIDLSPTLTVTEHSYNIFQENYYDFLSHIFHWPVDGDAFLPLDGTQATVTLTVSVPEDFECNGNDERCKEMWYKWGAADEGMNQPKTPSSLFGGRGNFDITCNENSITFGGDCSQAPMCGDGIKNQESEECDGSDGVLSCGSGYTGKYWCTENCQLMNNCTKTEGHHGGGGGSSTETQPTTCTPKWQCTDFGMCIDNLQFRVCNDLSDCNSIEGKPLERQACSTEKTNNQEITTNGNTNNNPDKITGWFANGSPVVGGVLVVLIVALAIVIAIVARRLSVRK
jgi:hypothetical protein